MALNKGVENMTLKALSALALLAALPATGAYAADYQYGYEQSTHTSTDAAGNVSNTSVEKSWASKNPAPAAVTDVNAPADMQPGMTETSTETTTETYGDAAGQHTKAWYRQNLQRNGRYVLDPDTNKLTPVVENPEIHKLNRAARAKAGAGEDNGQ
jgi:hypothetical protein